MPRKRTRYDREFKLRVVERSYEVDRIKDLGAEFGLRPELIYRWRAEFASQPTTSFSGNGKTAVTAEEAENARLRKELADVKMEHEILKKAIAIFSKTGGKRSNL